LACSVFGDNPISIMEAAAAGRLVLGRPAAHFEALAYLGAAIMGPIETDRFEHFCTATLRYYKDRPAELSAKCRSIQEAAQEFDSRQRVEDWLTLVNSAKHQSVLSRSYRLFTAHGTVLYVDCCGILRHGPLDASPRNALFVRQGTTGHILELVDDALHP